MNEKVKGLKKLTYEKIAENYSTERLVHVVWPFYLSTSSLCLGLQGSALGM